MNTSDILIWSIFIVGGFLLGGIMFSQILPKAIAKKDIAAISSDHNPGASNVFLNCGVSLGLLCLFLDMLKGFLPVYMAARQLDTQQLLFAAVLVAPVLGHALAPFNDFHGGKCIATVFGEMIALWSQTKVGLILAGLYIFFSTIVKINPNRRRSLVTFLLFGALSFGLLARSGQYPLAIGCGLISLITVTRHMKGLCRI